MGYAFLLYMISKYSNLWIKLYKYEENQRNVNQVYKPNSIFVLHCEWMIRLND